MPVLVTSKFNEVPIKNDQASLETPFPIISLWEIFQTLKAVNSIVSGPIWPKFELIRDLMHVLVACKYKQNRIKKRKG